MSQFRAEDTPAEGAEYARQRRGGIGHRADDDPDDGERYMRQRRHERARTIFLAVMISGIVALGVVFSVELGARNNAVDACQLEMQTRTLLRDQADQAADGVLGDTTTKDGDPNRNVRPFDFTGTAFDNKQIRALIIAQARTNRRRAIDYQSIIRNCNDLFPRPKLFGVIG